MPKKLIGAGVFAAAPGLAASGAAPADASCTAKAAEKKLAGAALTSFMKKCEEDAATACNADSKAKKLAGAALDSHMKKCIGDAVGKKAEAAPAAARAGAPPRAPGQGPARRRARHGSGCSGCACRQAGRSGEEVGARDSLPGK